MKKNKYCPDDIHEVHVDFDTPYPHECFTCKALNRQREDMEKEIITNILNMLKEKPGEAGWSRAFNERLVEKLKQSLKDSAEKELPVEDEDAPGIW